MLTAKDRFISLVTENLPKMQSLVMEMEKEGDWESLEYSQMSADPRSNQILVTIQQALLGV